MKVLRLSSLLLLVALVLAVGAAPALAQCQLDGCTSNCAGGCGASSFPIQHPTFGLGGNDAVIDLTATDYGPADAGGSNCDSGAGMPCDNVGDIPPLRFWAYDAYTTANSGCALTTRVGQSWIINCEYDQAGCAGVSTDGYWIFSQANWATPATPSMDTGDGCISSAPNARTVIEMSWGDSLSNEGSDTHDAWYVIASVDFTGVYDFDRITGGTGANGVGDGTLAAQSVPDVSVAATCPNNGTVVQGSANAVDGNFFDIPVTISDTSPAFLTEAGLNPAGTPLIAGLEIVYWQGPRLRPPAIRRSGRRLSIRPTRPTRRRSSPTVRRTRPRSRSPTPAAVTPTGSARVSSTPTRPSTPAPATTRCTAGSAARAVRSPRVASVRSSRSRSTP